MSCCLRQRVVIRRRGYNLGTWFTLVRGHGSHFPNSLSERWRCPGWRPIPCSTHPRLDLPSRSTIFDILAMASIDPAAAAAHHPTNLSWPLRSPSREHGRHLPPTQRSAVLNPSTQRRDDWSRGGARRRLERDLLRNPAWSLRRAFPYHHRRAISQERLLTMSPDKVSPIFPTVQLSRACRGTHSVVTFLLSSPRVAGRCRPGRSRCLPRR